MFDVLAVVFILLQTIVSTPQHYSEETRIAAYQCIDTIEESLYSTKENAKDSEVDQPTFNRTHLQLKP